MTPPGSTRTVSSRGVGDARQLVRREPLSLDRAVERIEARALVEGPVGTVGLELEGHVIAREDARRPVDFARLARLCAHSPVLGSGGRLTLEPGGQLEISSAPWPDAISAIDGLRRDEASLRELLAERGLGWVTIGADPLRRPALLNPAPRYACMASWFAGHRPRSPGGGDAFIDHGRTMMCSSAALQINLEAGPRSQWTSRVARATRLGPLLTALSGSSSWLAGSRAGRVSARQAAWSGIDARIAGPLDVAGAGADPAALVRGWTGYVLGAPVMMIETGAEIEAEPVAASGAGCGGPTLTRADRDRTFGDWLRDPRPWAAPTEADLDRHLTLLFPPVRLRGWLELRCLDALPARWWPALSALVCTWMDDPASAAKLDELLVEVGDRWRQAATIGLGDDALWTVARAALADAAPRVGSAWADQVDELADLVDQRRTPGSLLHDRIERVGPRRAMEELAGE